MTTQQSLEQKLLISEVPKIPVQKERFICLDVFRGLTMLGMILVDSQGNFNYVIWPLNESEWNGLTTADCVFPSFLFIMGMAVIFAIKPEQKHDSATWFRIIKRTFLLFLIGVLLNMEARIYRDYFYSTFNFRVMGVLQRAAICYIIVIVMYMFTPKFYYNFLIIGGLSIIYICFMYLYDVPDQNGQECGRGVLTQWCNFSGYLDRQIFPVGYSMRPTDPEGIFSTLTAILNAFMGLYYSYLFKLYKSNKLKLLKIWLGLSFILIGCGYLVRIGMPFNKKIWTFSFALATSGISGLSLSVCFWLLDIVNIEMIKKIFVPCVWLGMNPLFVFVGMIFVDNIIMNNIYIFYNSTTDNQSLWAWMTVHWFQSWISDYYFSSFLISFIHLSIWTFFAWLLYRKKIFIKL